MNGKKARAIRQFAEYVVDEGTPNREYEITRKSRPRSVVTETGETLKVTPPGTIALKPDCTRAIYQRMKNSVA